MSRFHRTSHKKSSLERNLLIGTIAFLVPVIGLIGFHYAAPATDAIVKKPFAYPPVAQITHEQQRIYYVDQQPQGYVLMYSTVQGAITPLSLLPDNFGDDAGDSIATMQPSPGNRYIAIDGQRDHGDDVWIVDANSGTLQTLPANSNGNFLHWLPDGQHFLYRPYLPLGPAITAWKEGLWIVDAATGNHMNISLPDAMDSTQLSDAAPSPDGRQIVLSTTAGLHTGSIVWQMAPDGSNIRQMFRSSEIVNTLAWSPDGNHIAYESSPDTAVPYRPASLWLMSPQTAARQQIGMADGGHGYQLAWSQNSRTIAFVARINGGAANADSYAGALVSSINAYSMLSGTVTTIAGPDQTHLARNINPVWQRDGALYFSAMGSSSAQSAAGLMPVTFWSASQKPLSDGTQSYDLSQIGASRSGLANLFAIQG